MAVEVIDKLKPKNGGSFPVVEGVDVEVSEGLRLPEALNQKAEQTDLEELSDELAGKASAADLTAATANLQGQINQIEISATEEAVVAPEVAAARVDEKGEEYSTLKERLDSNQKHYDYKFDDYSEFNSHFIDIGIKDLTTTYGTVFTRINSYTVGVDTTNLNQNQKNPDEYIIMDDSTEFEFKKNEPYYIYFEPSTAGITLQISYVNTSDERNYLVNTSDTVNSTITFPSNTVKIKIRITALKAVGVANCILKIYNEHTYSPQDIAHINEIANNRKSIEIIAHDQEYIDTEWLRGVAGTDGTVNETPTYGYATVSPLSYNRKINIYVSTGFRAFVRYYTDNVYQDSSAWFTDSITLNKDQQFMLTVAKYPADESDVATQEYAKEITITTKTRSDINELYNIAAEQQVRFTKDEETVNNLADEFEYLDSEWLRGVAKTDGTVNETPTYGYATVSPLSYERKITISVSSGYQAFIQYFVDGAYQTTSQWFTEPVTLEAGQQFMLTVAKSPLDTTDSATLEYTKKITIATRAREDINDLLKKTENQWEGKEWYAFGSSISDSSQPMPFDAQGGVTGKYPAYLCELSGLIHHNYAKSGSTISNMAHTNADGLHPTVIQKIDEAIEDGDIANADLISIEGFVNDWGASNVCPIGELTDTTDGENNDTTLYMAMHTALTKIAAVAPNARVVFISDSTGKEFYSPYTGALVGDLSYDRTSSGYHQRDYVDAMRKFCEYTGTLFIDAGQISEINCLHPQYIGDHIHHSFLGGEQYAKAIWSVLKDIYPNVRATDSEDT